MNPILEINNLSFTYHDGTEAIKNVSLKIDHGEKVGIIGPNGAGKSTLILHVNGLIKSKGNVIIDGEPVEKSNLSDVRRKVALVFQNPDDQLFCPTLYDDVAFGPVNMGLGKDKIGDLVSESLRKVGLSGMEKRGSFHLSFGEKRRAALATVLAMDPKLLVLDEPTSGLDPRGCREVIELLSEIGGTQFIISHDLVNLSKMVERVILMSEGEIIADGRADEILNNRMLLDQAGLI